MSSNRLPEVDLFINPISPDQPCGEDMSFSAEFDQIQEARREDDASLHQGDWVTNLKEADWKFSGDLCQKLLCEKTKDLRLLSWLSEALAKTHDIAGLGRGLEVFESLVDQYWEQLHPLTEDGDQEQRIGNISWLITRGVRLVSAFPLVAHKSVRYGLATLESARSLQSLIDRNQPLEESTGTRISLQQIREAQRNTPRSFYQQTIADSEKCRSTLAKLEQKIDAHLGLEGPSFAPLRTALEAYTSELGRFGRENGVSQTTGEATPPKPADDTINGESSNNGSTASATTVPTSLHSREQALQQLRLVAEFFRHTEPHSPVAYLADKAANWGEMPLHVWLKAVLKEEGSLSRFEDLLGFGSADGEEQG